MTKSKRIRLSAIVAAVAVAALWLVPASAQAPPEEAAVSSGATQNEIELLREQIDALSQKIKVIERNNELDKEARDTKAKATPVVALKDGSFSLASPDNKFQLKIGGHVATDFAWFRQDDELERAFGDEQDGAGFRSARIKLGGKFTDAIEWQTEIEFAGANGQDTPSFFDTYVQFAEVPYFAGQAGTLRIGHYREPFSLEELTSQKSRIFQERSLASVFYPSRNIGVQWSDAILGEPGAERLTYALGVFKTVDNWPSSDDSDEDQGYAITARVTGVPYVADGGQKLIHLGAGYSHRNPDGAVLGWNTRPETRLSQYRYSNADNAPALFRLRDARADDVDLFNVEAALSYGPLLVQGEYTFASVDTTFGGSRSFDGYYLQAAYVLTGEHHPYRFNQGLFDRVKPKKNFGFKADDGWGAWELAARWASVDLDDGPVRGGEQQSATLGVNWYLNANTSASINYLHNWVETGTAKGEFDVLQTRIRFDF